MATVDIPKQHKAVVYSDPGKSAVEVTDVDTPQPGPGEVLVRLTHSGVCHSDYSIMTNSWPLPAPTAKGQVGGHEGVGKVVALGDGVKGRAVGDRVGIKWVSSACGSCPACFEGMDGVCFNGKVSGYYTPGTFQQYVLGPADYVTPIPDGLADELAAPMLCAGLTTYTAIKRARVEAGQWLVVCGAGGGLGHIAVQLAAKGFGLRVIGVDIGSKKDLVLECGAEAFVDVGEHKPEELPEAVKKLTGREGKAAGAKGALVCHADNDAYAQALQMLCFGGTLVCVGIPEGQPIPIKTAIPALMIFNMLTVTSTAVGNRKEAVEVLEMAARGIVKTKVEVRKMDQLQQTFDDMNNRKLQGRVVLDLN